MGFAKQQHFADDASADDDHSTAQASPKHASKRHSEQSSAELRYPRKRSVRACHLCRARKTKCDNLQPTCGFCQSIGAHCSYDEKQHDHSSFDSASLEILRKLSELAESQNQILRILQSVGNNTGASPQSRSSSVMPTPVPTAPPTMVHPLLGNEAYRQASEQPHQIIDNSYSPSQYPAAQDTIPVVHRHANLPVSEFGEPYNARAYSRTSPMSQIEMGSAASAPQGNPAAIRWFDLLATDAGKDGVQAALTLSEATPDRGHAQNVGDGLEVTPLQQATRVIDEHDKKSDDAQSGPQPQVEGSDRVSSRLLERRLWQAENDIRLLPREQVLFSKFVHEICLSLDLCDPRRTFSAVVSRLALRNAGLMNAVLAVSCHYASLESNPKIQDHRTPLQYYDQTIHYLQRAMRYSSYQISKELLATTLIISIYEMLTGSRADWDRHLQGIFWILRSQKIDVETDGVESAVWWAWLKQDIWAAFREKRITYTTWRPKKSYAELSPHELASRATWILSQVVSFCHVDGDDNTEATRVADRLERSKDLSRMLAEWDRHLTVEFTPLPSPALESTSAFRPISIFPSCFGIAVQAHYVSKILVCIHEPCLGGMDSYLDRLRTVQAWIRVVCGIAMTLTDDASSMTCSQFLYIAGLFAQDPREQDCIIDMLESCCERSGWWAGPLHEDLRAAWTKTSGSRNGEL